ncbi:MAG: hypothetical protein AAFV53_08105 [Myxococcota bacterium]
MSTTYLEQTIDWLKVQGFVVERTEDTAEQHGKILFTRTRFDLRRGPDEHLGIEELCYPDGRQIWYLDIVRFHGLRSTSFPLDSWKYRDAYVEFKYYTHPDTGMGLSVVLERRMEADDV